MAVLKCNIRSPHYLILSKPKYYYIGGIWGRKSNVVRPRGEENQRTRGGGKKSKVVQLYTPLLLIAYKPTLLEGVSPGR